MFFKKREFVEEERIKIPFYGEKISKELEVFYNPVMKLNRDISLLVIKALSLEKQRPLVFVDPMVASGVRELRFLKTIPECFSKLVLGDISKKALKTTKKNVKLNELSDKICNYFHQDANNTLLAQYGDFIEIDPFGSPIPFIDAALQRIKHKGILSVTATDTAALCGTYPKTTYRKYGMKVEKTQYYEELGLRNLIAFCQSQAAKYDKSLEVLVSYSQDHYYKIFFQVFESRTQAYEMRKALKYIAWDKKNQETKVLEIEEKGALGKTYVGPLCQKEFIEKLLGLISLIEDHKQLKTMLERLKEEPEIVGYINPHLFCKYHKFESHMKFEELRTRLITKGFEATKVHNNKLGLKTTAPTQVIIETMREDLQK